MADPGPLLDGIVDSLAALAFLVVGIALARRPTTPEARPAVLGFAAFWILYGLNLGFSAWRVLRVAAGDFSVLPFVVLFVVESGMAVLALYGLFLHLLFLLNGTYRGHAWVLVATGTMATVIGAIVVGHEPMSVVIEGWRTDLVFATPLSALTRWSMVVAYFGTMLFVAGAILVVGRNSRGGTRRRAFGLSISLFLLAAMDAITIGPEEAIPFGFLATVGKLVAVAIVARLYLFRQNGHLRTTKTPHS